MADQSDRPEPDVEGDAREGEVGDVGYPEAQPEGEDGGSALPRGGPGARRAGARARETAAPSVSGEQDRPPSKATGNPRAAGP